VDPILTQRCFTVTLNNTISSARIRAPPSSIPLPTLATRRWTWPQIEVFNPVPGAVFDAYRDVAPIDSGFDERRELWRLWCYLAVAKVEQQSTPFGRTMFRRLSDAVNRYR
jgi:hypothetical protein